MHIERTLYVAVNKNTDELYCERIKFNKDAYASLMKRAKKIITGHNAQRCATRPEDYRCNMCSYKDVCWNTEERLVMLEKGCAIDCRSCCHAKPIIDEDGARWSCGVGKSDCHWPTCRMFGSHLFAYNCFCWHGGRWGRLD